MKNTREPWRGKPCKAIVQMNGSPIMFACGRESIGNLEMNITGTQIGKEMVNGAKYVVPVCDVHLAINEAVIRTVEEQKATAAAAQQPRARVALPVDALGRPIATPEQARAQQAIEIVRK